MLAPAGYEVVRMNVQMQFPGERLPVCGALSLITPFTSIPVFLVADRIVRRLQPRGEMDFGLVMLLALPVIACFVPGMLLAGLAAWRDEKCRPLYWFGFLLNVLLLVYTFLKS